MEKTRKPFGESLPMCVSPVEPLPPVSCFECKSVIFLSVQNAARLPANKPRYVMGVGYPLDLVVCVALGADMYANISISGC